MEKFLSRKWLLAVLVVVLGAVLLFTAKITFDQFSALIAPVVGFYFAANVITDVADTVAFSKYEETEKPESEIKTV